MALDDTDPLSLRAQGDVLRALSGPEKFRAACDLTMLALRGTRAGLRDRFPDATEEQLDEEHYRLAFGPDIARSVLDYRRRVRAVRDADS